MEEYECPNGCVTPQIVEDHAQGDVICGECGTVITERIIDPGEEWRTFSESTKDASRVERANPFLDEGSLSTVISRKSVDGKTANSSTQRLHDRLSLSSQDRTVLSAFEKIGQIASLLNLSERIKLRAKEIFSEYEKNRPKTVKHNQDAVICAILCISSKEEATPRTFKEFRNLTNVDEKEIRKYYKLVLKLLNKQTVRTSAVDLVSRYCSTLKLPHNVTRAAEEVTKEASLSMEGKSPSSIAGAAIFIVTRALGGTNERTEVDVSSAAHISLTTLRTVLKEMAPIQDKLISKIHISSSSTSVSSPVSSSTS